MIPICCLYWIKFVRCSAKSLSENSKGSVFAEKVGPRIQELTGYVGTRMAGVMPRKLRIEYPGAVYHVMSRGDHREAVYRDD